jgi:hypothetical protein
MSACAWGAASKACALDTLVPSRTSHICSWQCLCQAGPHHASGRRGVWFDTWSVRPAPRAQPAKCRRSGGANGPIQTPRPRPAPPRVAAPRRLSVGRRSSVPSGRRGSAPMAPPGWIFMPPSHTIVSMKQVLVVQLQPVPARRDALLATLRRFDAAGDRASQARFLCMSCGFAAYADMNTAEHIRRAAVMQPYGAPLSP